MSLTSFRSFKQFIISPEFTEADGVQLTDKLLILIKYFLLSIGLILLATAIDMVLQGIGLYPTFQNKLSSTILNAPNESSNWIFALVTLLSAPLLEELQFRLLLHRYNLDYISISFSLFSGFHTYNLTAAFLWKTGGDTLGVFLPLACTLSFGLILIYPVRAIMRRLVQKSRLENVWNRHPCVWVYLSVVAFALVHLQNFTDMEAIHYICLPITLLPYIIYGWVLSFIRIRLGLAYSILLHSFYLAPILIKLLLI